ncbi:MAG TPA: HigA family addiction module antitoxin [Stellaceae bacterium]|nr:HigA family addiction module antitoxin [Stellaceae bacterium]
MRPVHPGEILRLDVLDELGLSARALAKALGVPPNRITGILNRERAITADTALRLARYLGTAPEFWLNLQAAYDLRIAKEQVGRTITKRVRPRAA